MFIKPNFSANALSNLIQPAGAGFSMTGEDFTWEPVLDSSGNPTAVNKIANVNFFDTSTVIPTKAALEAEIVRLEAEWESTEYQRLRKQQYPSWEVLADAVYWQEKGDSTKMAAYLASVEAVKVAYPKD
jgi:hypothetical protein